jgi:signal transduction histidine kinase/ActR/RegA family two-component response regulator
VALLAEATAELLASHEPQKVVQRLCWRLLDHLDCDLYINYLLDADTARLHLNASHGIPAEFAEQVEWLDQGVAVCGTVARDGQRMVVEDVQHSGDSRASVVRSLGMQAYACHPLLSNGKVIGTLSFGTRSRVRFGPDELALMEAVASQVTVAMERIQLEHDLQDANQNLQRRADHLRSLAAQLTQAEQRERQRLAHVLHDDLQQMLVGAKFDLRTALDQIQDDPVLHTLEHVESVLDQSLQLSRSLTVDLCPPILYRGTLEQALRWLANWMEPRHGLQVEVETEGSDGPLSGDIRILLFHAVRELLLNVVKHAGTHRARVHMRWAGEYLEVTVTDRGQGFDAARLTNRGGADGFGLFSIRERLESLGGSLDLQSVPGAGTTVSLRAAVASPGELPVSAAAIAETHEAIRAVPVAAAPADGEVHRIRVLLADDHLVVREGLARLLQMQQDIEIVGKASDGCNAVEMAQQLQPDVVIMDVSMPCLSGMEATRRIRSEMPAVCVIGLSMHNEQDVAAAMSAAGACAYLPKTAPPDTLIAAIRSSVSGQQTP